MSKFYVYTLSYPAEMGGQVFYVGKGQNGRIDDHEKQAMTGYQGPRFDVIRSIWAEGHQIVKQKVYETDSPTDALLRETDLIKHYGLNNLTNVISGVTRASEASGEDDFEFERTTIQLIPRLMEKLDRLRRRLGISRSAMLAILIDQWPDHDERETTEE